MTLFERNAGLVFGVLGGQLWSTTMLKTVAGELWRRGPRGFAAFAGEALVTARAYLETRYRSELVRDLFAPWVLHTGLGPDQAVSGFMTQVIGCAVQLGGMPVPRGGGVRLVEALAAIVREHGGELRTSADAERIWRSGCVTVGTTGHPRHGTQLNTRLPTLVDI